MQSIYNKLNNRLKVFYSGLHCRTIRLIHPLLPNPVIKIYDCFLFNNELELLRLRLSELYSCVDYFVICECAVTFSGVKKPLYYLENKILFESFQDKIKGTSKNRNRA
jgi:hypothetical protein